MPWAAVIGSPVDHSLSPQLHKAAWEAAGLSDEWSYFRHEVDKDSLEKFMTTLAPDLAGLSVTMPCKQSIMRYVDIIDPLAETVGAVNTVVPAAGLLVGANTDVHGIVAAIGAARARSGLGAPDTALILGSGATASSALAAVGTLGVSTVKVAARRFFGSSIIEASHRLGVEINQVPLTSSEAVVAACRNADVMISTLPATVADDLAGRLEPRSSQTLLDVVYAPRLTGLVRTWTNHGANIAYGIDMFVHQGAQQVALMTGVDPDINALFDAVRGLQ